MNFRKRPISSTNKLLLKLSLIFIFYFVTAKLGLTLDAVSGFATLVWPPTGIALASILLFGYRYWPAIFGGAVLVNLSLGAPFITAIGIGIGNTLEALAGAFLLVRFAGFRNSLDRIKDVVSLVVLACIFSTLVSATIGVASLWLGNVKTEGFGATWSAWWFGDILGDLIVAPLFLVWATRFRSKDFEIKMNTWSLLEIFLLALSLTLVGVALFSEFVVHIGIPSPTLPYIFFPFIVWASLRFDQLGNTLVVSLITAFAIWGTIHGYGPFSHETLRENLFLLNSFISIIALTGMILAGSVAEREQALEDRRKSEWAEKFLAKAGEILTSSLDYESRISSIVRLALPSLADWCVLDVVDEDGALKRVSTAHIDPAKEELLLQLQDSFPPKMTSAQPAARALLNRKNWLLNEMTSEDIRAHCRDDEHAQYVNKIGIKSHLAVPLILQDKIIGVLSLGREMRASFGESEITLIERLAKRAALAIDNAKLYASAEAERTKLKSLFLQAPAIINILRGPEHIFDLVHPLTKELLGGRDVTGMSVREAMPELEGQVFFEALDNVYKTGELFHGREIASELKMPDGSIKKTYWDFIYQPWYETKEKIGGVMTFAVDISEQVLARRKIEALARTSAILSNCLDYEITLSKVADLIVPEWADWCAIDLLDEDDKLKSIAVAHRDPRYPTDLNSSTGASNVIRTGRSELHPEITDSFIDRIAKDPSHSQLLKSLGIRSVIVVPLSSQGKTLGTITFIAAESRRKYGPDDLSLAEDLGRRAGVAIENARLYRDIQRAVQIRDDFLSVASHELRTPLTGLYLELQMIERMVSKSDLKKLSIKKLSERIGISEKQTKLLASLIDGLLDVTNLGRKKLTIQKETLDISEITKEILSGFKEEAKNIGSALLFHRHKKIIGNFDKVRVTQAISNLISNALKYGAGKPIEVILKSEGKKAEIIVKDQGSGISPKDQTRIFGRFERAVSHQNISGMGLGLYITKEIAEAHGGVVRLESELGKGSTFILELPLSALEPRVASL